MLSAAKHPLAAAETLRAHRLVLSEAEGTRPQGDMLKSFFQNLAL